MVENNNNKKEKQLPTTTNHVFDRIFSPLPRTVLGPILPAFWHSDEHDSERLAGHTIFRRRKINETV
jgi:hypothetical protein